MTGPARLRPPVPARRLLLQGAGVLVLGGLLAACSEAPPAFQGTDITGTRLGQDLALTDHHGQARTLADFRGKAVVAFFGFAQCPDVCPTAMAELAQVLGELGPDGDRVQVLLITVDPERDTPEVLRAYVSAFDPRFLGLTGSPEQLKQTAASFRAYYAKSPRPDGDYSMDHTAGFYLFDPQGQVRVLAGPTAGTAALAHDLRLLLNSA